MPLTARLGLLRPTFFAPPSPRSLHLSPLSSPRIASQILKWSLKGENLHAAVDVRRQLNLPSDLVNRIRRESRSFRQVNMDKRG